MNKITLPAKVVKTQSKHVSGMKKPLSSLICTNMRLNSLKNYRRPPTYREQIKAGVPFGKRKFFGRENQTYIQVSFGLSLLLAFVATPFLGRKLAKDEKFRQSLPSWYFGDYIMKHPKPASTRKELQKELTQMQKELHERAIRGDFAEENLKKMVLHGEFRDDPYGWSKIHPGLDEDDDDETSDEE